MFLFKKLLYTQVRTKVLDVYGLLYKPRASIRSQKDLVKEEREVKEKFYKQQNSATYSIFSNNIRTLKDFIFYTDSICGKLYFDFKNTSYSHRAYKWSSIQIMLISNVVVGAFLINFVDIEW